VNPRGFQVLLNAEKEVSKLWALLSSLLAIQSEAGKKKGNLLTASRPEPVHQHPPVHPQSIDGWMNRWMDGWMMCGQDKLSGMNLPLMVIRLALKVHNHSSQH